MFPQNKGINMILRYFNETYTIGLEILCKAIENLLYMSIHSSV